MENFMNLFRFRLYERTGILVNDLTDVFKEIKLFIDGKIKPDLENLEISGFIFHKIELQKEEFKWKVIIEDEMTDDIREFITLNNVNDRFKGKKEFLKSLEEEHGISMFPQDLYGKASIVFTEVVSEFISQKDLIDKIEIFDILTIDNNGINNIIY